MAAEVTPVAARPLVRPRRSRRRKASAFVRYAVIVVVCVVALFPVYWMVLTTFQPEQDSITYPPDLLPHGIQFSTLTSLFDGNPIAAWLLHSLTVSAVTVVVTLIFAIPGAYLLSRLRWRGVGPFGFLLLFTQLMPGAMVVVPELQFFRELGWTNNLLAIGVLYAAFNVPLGCWILKSSFDTVPSEVVDAALVDGCGRMRVLYRVLLPLSKPGVVAVAIVAFFGSWNDYLFAAAFLTNQSLYTAGLGISTFISDQTIKLDQLEAAGVVFSLLPVLLYLTVQRHVVRGLTAGAIK
ncbi:MAG TPA: carbohydrate ABC transporter permease [Streptosporangiaceae bacterium]|nr:carbohydrate ABC transporter permease [Streptosporangiaceae bacterium]